MMLINQFLNECLNYCHMQVNRANHSDYSENIIYIGWRGVIAFLASVFIHCIVVTLL